MFNHKLGMLVAVGIGALVLSSGSVAQPTQALIAPLNPNLQKVIIPRIPPNTLPVDRSKTLRQLETKEKLNNLGVIDISKIKFPFFPLLPQEPRVTFNDTGRTLCHYRNNFFEKSVRATYLFDADPITADDLNPPHVDEFGNYYLQPPSAAGNYNITVDCDGSQYTTAVNVANPANFTAPDIQLSNAPPVVTSFEAQKSGSNIVGTTKNTTIDLVVSASDPNGDPLTLSWGANAGSIISTTGSSAKWKLPNAKGLNFAYVLVTDSKGGYAERNVIVSTDAGVVNGSQASVPASTADKLPRVDHFLTFFSTRQRHSYLPSGSLGADSKIGSCRYYAALGAVGGCDDHGNMLGKPLDFATWKANWGLNVAGADVRATFLNMADLNLQRDMHGISNANGTAYYVCNYPPADQLPVGTDLTNAIKNKNLVACVAMEYSPSAGVSGGLPFTKFYVFAPSGALLQSVNLDGRGEKYIPGSCVVCHGAKHDFSRVAENGVTSPDLGAQFLPFDLDNYSYSSKPGLTRADQEAKLRKLNEMLLATNPNQTIKDVIAGWYPTLAGNFNSSFVPAGWAPNPNLYNNVVKPHCRTCHVAMPKDDNGDDLSFPSFDEFRKFNFQHGDRVCGDGAGVARKRYSMPNSKVTFNRFWASPTAASTLEQHLIADGEFQPGDKCSPPQ
jgi:hypothetical protein